MTSYSSKFSNNVVYITGLESNRFMNYLVCVSCVVMYYWYSYYLYEVFVFYVDFVDRNSLAITRAAFCKNIIAKSRQLNLHTIQRIELF